MIIKRNDGMNLIGTPEEIIEYERLMKSGCKYTYVDRPAKPILNKKRKFKIVPFKRILGPNYEAEVVSSINSGKRNEEVLAELFDKIKAQSTQVEFSDKKLSKRIMNKIRWLMWMDKKKEAKS